MITAILNLLMRSDPEDGYLKNVHSLAYGHTVTKYSAGLGFQHLPRDLANVNAWKSMFDPYIEKILV